MPATTAPSALTGMPPAPGNNASGDAAANPAATGGAIDVIRCRCSALGICCVAEIHALERARAIPPGPPASIRDAVISAPLAPTTAIPPRRPSCSALSTARCTSARASARLMSYGCMCFLASGAPWGPLARSGAGHVVAAVGDHVAAGHVRGVVGREEQGGAGELGGSR